MLLQLARLISSLTYLYQLFILLTVDICIRPNKFRNIAIKIEYLICIFLLDTLACRIVFIVLSYCTCFYCPLLWTHYKKSTHSKLRVAFNNVYRRILKLLPRSSASTMYAINNIDSFEVLIRKRIFGFTERLNNCENTIIKCINNSRDVEI